jgi:hypothetical protein
MDGEGTWWRQMSLGVGSGLATERSALRKQSTRAFNEHFIVASQVDTANSRAGQGGSSGL